jgi:radical SAM superfamily enzyme YgiQ (UPF0313 family)
MHVTLIKPNIGVLSGGGRYLDSGRMEPLQLGVLAGLTPESVTLTLVDDRCEDMRYETPTDLAAITVETFTARRAYEIAGEYRKRGVPVVLGGFHPTLCPEEAIQHGDSIVIGDAESVWLDVLDDAASGNLRPRYSSRESQPQRGGVLPRRDLFRGKGYLPISLIQFGRGCQNQCDYCAVGSYSERKNVHRPIGEVVREIRAQRRDLLFFVDDNIVADREAARDLFRALVPLQIKWVSQGTLDMVEDGELMDLMVRSGCLGHVIGFETLDPRNLRASGKPNRLDPVSGYDAQVRALRSYGLQTWAAFTLGYEYDTPDSLGALLEFALRHRFAFAAFNVLMPYPGTPFYDRLKQENRLLFEGRWWLHPAYRFNHAAFVPAMMKPEELTETAFRLRKRWNGPLSLFRRFVDLRTNLRSLRSAALFFNYNRVFRAETFRKQDMRFGYSAAMDSGAERAAGDSIQEKAP